MSLVPISLFLSGIYMKFRGCGPCDPDDADCVPGVDDVAQISNVLYENIYIEQPSQFALFIGPAQQYIINRDCALVTEQRINRLKCLSFYPLTTVNV